MKKENLITQCMTITKLNLGERWDSKIHGDTQINIAKTPEDALRMGLERQKELESKEQKR